MTFKNWQTAVQQHLASTQWALVPLRLLVGFGFAAHGYAKLARGPESFGRILAAMGIPAPEPTAWVTALVELLGGVSIMLGAYVLPVAVPLAVIMVTAMIRVHLRYGFSSIRLTQITESGPVFGPVGYELNLLYIAALVALAASGPSPLSLDRWLNGKLTGPPSQRELRSRSSRGTRTASPALPDRRGS
jgi:putative oxidoreductase